MSTPEKACMLGNVVRDPITGFTGTAVQEVRLLNGTIQFAVQPKCEGRPEEPTKFPEAYNFDTHLLEFVEDGIAAKATPPTPAKLALGDQVKDEITGITGIATMEAIFINGCRYFSVQPEKKDKKATKPPEAIFVSQDRLTIIERGVFKAKTAEVTLQEVLNKNVVTAAPRKAPGGPTTRAFRAT